MEMRFPTMDGMNMALITQPCSDKFVMTPRMRKAVGQRIVAGSSIACRQERRGSQERVFIDRFTCEALWHPVGSFNMAGVNVPFP